MRRVVIRCLLTFALLFSTAVSARMSIDAGLARMADTPCADMGGDRESPCPCCATDLVALDCYHACTVAPMMPAMTSIVARTPAVTLPRRSHSIAFAQNLAPPPTPPPIS